MQITRNVRTRLVAIAALALLLGACTAESGTGSGSTTTQAAGSGSGTSISVDDAFTSVTVRVIDPPTFPFHGTDGLWHVSYDLELTNTAGAVTATVEKLEIIDAADRTKVLETIEGDQLLDPTCPVGDCNRVRMVPGRPAEDVQIPPQQSRTVFVDLTFDSADEVPGDVLHHLYLQAADTPRAETPAPVDYIVTPYAIDTRTAPVIGPPLTGSNWIAFNGCCEVGLGHRSSPNSVNGMIVNGQHFAIDWKQMNDEGQLFEGDPNENENWVDYGADVLAVADGTVVATLDGMAANRPGVLPAADPELADTITIETVDGNHIVLDLGNGIYAFYAHLQADSLLVQEGDKVTKGQKIAKLGNTGNGNASHLHFHLMSGPSVLGSSGIPYVIDSFGYRGQVPLATFLETDDMMTGTFNGEQLATADPREDELPMLLAIVDFPEG